MNRLLPLALLMLAPMASAAAQPAPPAAADPSAQLVISASALRLAFASGGALDILPADEARLLSDRLGLGRAFDRAAFEAVIGAGTQFLRRDETSAESLWWNPLVDAGVALRWSRTPSGWRIVDAAPFTGETLRGNAMPIGPDCIAGLRALSSATRAAFRADGTGRLFAAPAARAELLARYAAAQRSFAGAPALAERLQVGESLLIRSGTRNPTRLDLRLAGMGSEARAMLVPWRRYADAEGESIAWISAGEPETLFILQYPSDPSAVAPSMVLAVDLIVREGGAS